MSDRPVRLWSELTSAEAAAFVALDPVGVLPVAAIEQHGPHLPLSTDLDIGMGLIERAWRELDADFPAALLPVIAVGTSGEHAGAAGTLSLSVDQLTQVIVSVGAGLAESGLRRLVIANSHGGNRSAIAAAGLSLRGEHGLLVVEASYFRFDRPDGDTFPAAEWRHGLHGGAVETSMMLHLRPDLVRRDAIARFQSIGEALEASMKVVGPQGAAPFSWLARDLNPEGVVGDATLATAELGALLVDHYGRTLADVIRDARGFPLHRLARG